MYVYDVRKLPGGSLACFDHSNLNSGFLNQSKRVTWRIQPNLIKNRNMARCTVYEDFPEEALAFMSQKLKRDSFRMPQAELEALLRVSLQTKQGTGAVSVAPGQSGTKDASHETLQSGTKYVYLEKKQDKSVSHENEQSKEGDPLETDQSGVAATKPKHKISTSQVFAGMTVSCGRGRLPAGNYTNSAFEVEVVKTYLHESMETVEIHLALVASFALGPIFLVLDPKADLASPSAPAPRPLIVPVDYPACGSFGKKLKPRVQKMFKNSSWENFSSGFPRSWVDTTD